MTEDEETVRLPVVGEIWRRIDTPALTVRIEHVDPVAGVEHVVRYLILRKIHAPVMTSIDNLFARKIGNMSFLGFLDEYELAEQGERHG